MVSGQTIKMGRKRVREEPEQQNEMGDFILVNFSMHIVNFVSNFMCICSRRVVLVMRDHGFNEWDLIPTYNVEENIYLCAFEWSENIWSHTIAGRIYIHVLIHHVHI